MTQGEKIMNRFLLFIFALMLFCCESPLFSQQKKKQKRTEETEKTKERPKKSKPDKKMPNLVPDSGFEKGKGRNPDHWSCIDGITAMWGTEGNPGRCLTFDTGVLQKDKKLFKTDEKAYKGPGKGGQYDTVGAHEGVWAYSEPIDLKKGDKYFIITCDVKSPFKATELCYPMILIRGFNRISAEDAGKDSSWFHTYHKDGPAYSEMFGPDKLYRKSKEGDYLMVYRHTLACRTIKLNEWQHFEMGFKLPSVPKFYPERLLLKPYAFWPSGVYHFDNITLRRATAEEVKRVNDARQSIRAIE